MKEVKVQLWTPYLYDDIAGRCDDDYLKIQIKNFKYNQNNLNGIKFIKTPKHIVVLKAEDQYNPDVPKEADLIFAGSVERMEKIVKNIKPFGAIIVRFSIFYGGPSGYTGNAPEETGYALDIPKDVPTTKLMLANDDFLNAILARDHQIIVEAVDKLNRQLIQPILITDHLANALRIKK